MVITSLHAAAIVTISSRLISSPWFNRSAFKDVGTASRRATNNRQRSPLQSPRELSPRMIFLGCLVGRRDRSARRVRIRAFLVVLDLPPLVRPSPGLGVPGYGEVVLEGEVVELVCSTPVDSALAIVGLEVASGDVPVHDLSWEVDTAEALKVVLVLAWQVAH